MIDYNNVLNELNELLPENSYENGRCFTYETTGYSDTIRYCDLVIYDSETVTLDEETYLCVFVECMKELYNIRRDLNYILVNSNIYENFNNMGPSGTTSKPKYKIGDWVASNPYYVKKEKINDVYGEVTDVFYNFHTHSWYYNFSNKEYYMNKVSENWLLEITEPKFKVGDSVFQHLERSCVNSSCRIEKLKWNYDQMIWEYVLDKAREDLYFPESELTRYFKVGDIIRNKLTKETFKVMSVNGMYKLINTQSITEDVLYYGNTNEFELV